MLKYNKNGFLKGVPARDLTDEEAKEYGRERLLKSGLYEEAERKPRRKKLDETPFEEVKE